MSTGHEIAITNFTPNETVYYPVIIIKGYVRNNTCQHNKNEIFLKGNLFKIVDNNFKALVELDIGENVIPVTYCCMSVSFTVSYSDRKTQFSVLPLYIVCEGHDGRFQAPEGERNDEESALRRISLGARLLQSVIADKLQGRKTFRLKGDCRVFRSRLHYLQARKMSQGDLWATIGREVIAADLGHETTKFMGFLSCTRYRGRSHDGSLTHEDVVENTEAHVALGGGGLALFGTACLYTWPEELSHVVEKFEDATPVDRANFMDDSCYRGTLGGCFSTTLGSVLHELCHTFDLGHTERGVMGRGFDDIWRVFLSSVSTFRQKSIEFREEPGEKSFLVKNEQKFEDSTFWTLSCLGILGYHKWLNNFDSLGGKVVKFESRLVSATAGLRVIELRSEDDGLVLTSWIFEGRVLRYSFQIPEALDLGRVVLFVEDNIGNIFKQVVNI